MIFKLHSTKQRESSPLILEPQKEFERKNYRETLPCMKRSGTILAEIRTQEDARFLGSEMFAGLVFYLWQSCLHLISSTAFEDSAKEKYSFPAVDIQ